MEQFTSETRLGDVIDDFCIKCRRLTNHSIVSILDGKAAKVRCRTCYNDHDYRFEQAPPSKKDLKKAEDLLKESLGIVAAEGEGEVEIEAEALAVNGTEHPAEVPAETTVEAETPVAKKGRGRTKKA